jgi:SNF2 family DNA or RNA helicase
VSYKYRLLHQNHCRMKDTQFYITIVTNSRFLCFLCLYLQLLPKLFANGHKVLIFSQMVRVLDLLEEYLKLKRYKYERLDGSTSSSSRTAAVSRFMRKSYQRFVMLLSTRVSFILRFIYVVVDGAFYLFFY